MMAGTESSRHVICTGQFIRDKCCVEMKEVQEVAMRVFVELSLADTVSTRDERLSEGFRARWAAGIYSARCAAFSRH